MNSDGIVLSFGGAQCLVRTDISREVWATHLEPYVLVGERRRGSTGEAWQEVVFDIERGGPLRALTDTTPVTLHGEVEGEMQLTRDGAILRNPSARAEYAISSRADKSLQRATFRYPTDAADEEIVADAIRVIRGWLAGVGETRGRGRVHASALAVNDDVWLFVGDSGAGKTSFMLSALAGGLGSFVANDKVQLDEEGFALGLPLAAAISTACLPELPGISVDARSRIIGGKLYLWPQDLVRGLATDCKAGGRVTHVVIARLDLQAKDVEINDATDAEQSAMRAGPMTHFTDRINPQWLLDLTGLDYVTGDRGYLDHARWLVASGNPWTSNGRASVLDRLAASSTTR